MRTGLRLNAQVVCTDSPAGHLADVILNRSNERVSHLVVELKGFGISTTWCRFHWCRQASRTACHCAARLRS